MSVAVYSVRYTATSPAGTFTETYDVPAHTHTEAEENALDFLLIVTAADVEIHILGAEVNATHPLNN